MCSLLFFSTMKINTSAGVKLKVNHPSLPQVPKLAPMPAPKLMLEKKKKS